MVMGCNQRRWHVYAVLALKNKEKRRKMNQINNDNAPKYDIRDWDPKHEKMSRGITLTEEEAYELSIMLAGEFEG